MATQVYEEESQTDLEASTQLPGTGKHCKVPDTLKSCGEKSPSLIQEMIESNKYALIWTSRKII